MQQAKFRLICLERGREMKLLKKIIGAITLGVAALALTGCVNIEVYEDADKYLAGTQYYDGELKTLEVHWTSGTVTLIQDESAGQITVKEDNNLEESKKVHSYFNDGVLKIHYCKSGIRFGNVVSSEKQLFVTFPSLEDLQLGITSGTANIEKLDATKVKITITSGTANLGQINCEEFKIGMTSGKINVASLETNKADFDTTSGKTTIDSLKTKEATFDSTSGSITANVSEAEKLDFHITSGDLDLTIPEKGATMTLNKTSGKFTSTREHKVENNVYTFGDGSCVLKVHITSGNVTIR